jgi:uncharacterized protein YkwD/LysM repeat protein
MKVKFIQIVMICILLGAFLAVIPARAQDATPTPADQLIGYVNGYRQTKGFNPLTANPHLMAAAQAQADYLAKTYDVEKDKDVDGTVGENGTLPFQRAYQYGYAPWDQFEVVENWIALNKNYPLERVVGNDWWKDSYHQKNMLDGWGTTYTDIGVGIAEQGNITFYIVDIGAVKETTGKMVITNEAGETIIFSPIETTVPLADGSIIHTVSEGENLQLIAMSYGISMATLLDYNGISQSGMAIYPGQKLVIRKPYGDVSTGQAFITATATETATATIAPTFTLRPKMTSTPSLTREPPTPTVTLTPTPSVMSQITPGGVGLLAVLLGGLGLLVFFIIFNRRRR